MGVSAVSPHATRQQTVPVERGGRPEPAIPSPHSARLLAEKGPAMLNATRDFRRLAVSIGAIAGLATVAMASAAATAPPLPSRAFAAAAKLELSQAEQERRFCAAVSAMADEGGPPDADFSPRATLWSCPKPQSPKPKIAVPAVHGPQFAGL